MRTTELAERFDRIMDVLGSEQCHSHVPLEVRRLVNELRNMCHMNQAGLSQWQFPILQQMITQLDRAVEWMERSYLEVPVTEAVGITVNGVAHPMASNIALSHLNISMLAYGDEKNTEHMTCTYRVGDGPSSCLYRDGTSILPQEDMRFDISDSGAA